jgi:FkbM family methyltransferase
MMILRHIISGLKLVLAPWAYLIGRFAPRSRFGNVALDLDPQYLRALHLTMFHGASAQAVGRFRQAALIASEVDQILSMKMLRGLHKSESQFLQDVFCALALGEKEGGFFVEIGVGSGQEISNTYMLEKHYGWSGLLVEPNRSFHESIATCRTATLDKRAAASITGKTLKFQEMIGMGEHSRIANTGGHVLKGVEIREYAVETVSLTELLNEIGAPKVVDYLSLDTEGSEIDILKGIDFSSYVFKVMTIEHNFDKATIVQFDAMLVPLGYRRVIPHISAVDAWYIHDSVSSPGCSWDRGPA